MTKTVIYPWLVFLFMSTDISGQTGCPCFNGIGATAKSEPIMVVRLNQGKQLSVCGSRESGSLDEVIASEFNVFNCQNGKSLTEYDGTQFCSLRMMKGGLHIYELRYLPAGAGWKWMNVPIALQQIFTGEDEIVVLSPEPYWESIELHSSDINTFLESIRTNRRMELENGIEEVLGKLELLSYMGYDEAYKMLINFEDYMGIKTDGAIAEQWKDAVALAGWHRKSQ